MFRRPLLSRLHVLRNVSAPGATRRPFSGLGVFRRDRYPNAPDWLFNFFWGAKLLTGLALAGHVFVDYFYSVQSGWGPSMVPTFDVTGNYLLISKYYRHGRGLKVGDIISFKHPLSEHMSVSKRVIGMPGDFVLRDTPEKGEGYMIQVPLGHCWVVGDNMDASRDSRLYGPVPLGLVKGKIIGVWRSWSQMPEGIPDALQDFKDDLEEQEDVQAAAT